MIQPQPGIIVQARLASARLPAKALAPVGGRTILHRCLARLMSSEVARVTLATSDRPEDDVLALIAWRMGARVFRGDAADVLGRVTAAADAFNIDPIIRATCDNPAVDHAAPGRLLDAMRRTSADYAREEGLPVGAGVEAISAAALRASAALARDPFDREHVTTFIRATASPHRLALLEAPPALVAPSLRLTVDTPEDLARIRELFFRAGVEDPSVGELIAAARQSGQAAA
jgi:spore coat polysaccharide biosynthesis protein SpsF